MSNVIEKIVNNDLCIGCGVCAGICPKGLLTMDFNIYGEYNPFLKQPCSKECSLCMSVCPFNDNNINETEIGQELFEHTKGINYSVETGYYLNSFVGYSTQYRETSASGGMITWLLTTLLENNVVDYVICVASKDNSEKLFSFQIFEDAKAIIHSSGSVYYPVELSDVIKTIIDKPGRYAITGLPCFIKSLRLASARNQKLKERITFIVGLVCGQMKSKHYTTYLSELSNVGGNLHKVTYRGKSLDKPASNFYFHCINQEGTEGKLFWNEGVSEAWVNRWFTPNSCNFCDDIFAELADVAFMDAWLPEYSKDSMGNSLVLVRSSLVNEIIISGIKNTEINVSKIDIKKIIQSQAGVIELKRKMLSYRLYLRQKEGLNLLNKRVKLNKNINLIKKLEIEIKMKMQKLSKDFFINNFSENPFDIDQFRTLMKPYLNKSKLYVSFGERFILIFRIIQKIKHVLGSKI